MRIARSPTADGSPRLLRRDLLWAYSWILIHGTGEVDGTPIWTSDPTWPGTPVSRAKHVIPIITRLSHDTQEARDRVGEDIRHDRTLPHLLDLGVQLGVKAAHR